MELWKDEQTNTWHMLDAKTGQHYRCDRYGQPLTRFHLDQTGLMAPKDIAERQHQPYAAPSLQAETPYAAQPRKFDGYSQFPRPKSEAYFNDLHSAKTLRPVPRGQMPSNRLPNDIKHIPKPASFLTFSAVEDGTVRAPRFKRSATARVQEVAPETLTVEGLKTTLAKGPETLVKTAALFSSTLEAEKRQMTGYQPPTRKPDRRKLKGFFQLTYPSAEDCYARDMQLWRATNPEGHEAQQHYEALDRKNLEKRKAQRILQSQLMSK